MLQLKDKNLSTVDYEVVLQIIEKQPNLPLELIAKQTKFTLDYCKQLLHTIRSLNPKPTSKWQNENFISNRIPDAFVYFNEQKELIVELNLAQQPKILLNTSYYHELKKSVKIRADFTYLNQCHQQGGWLINALKQRAEILKKVIVEIVSLQQSFFTFGQMGLQPLKLETIAKNLNIHESTVSRVTTAKYLQTPLGIFDLKFFFNHEVSSKNNVTSKAIHQMLKEIIKTETPNKPLSDEQIVVIFNKAGINLARRTIAKYRDILGIKPSHMRKNIGNQTF